MNETSERFLPEDVLLALSAEELRCLIEDLGRGHDPFCLSLSGG